MHGHWARDCASGGQGRAPSVAGSVAGSYRGGFSTVGSQSLYMAHSTGRTYDATGPPPVPVFSVRPPPLGRGRPVPGTACPAPPALSGRAGPSAGQLMKGQLPAAASDPPARGAPMTRGAEHSTRVTRGRQWTAYGGAITWRSPSRWPSGGGPRVPWSGGPRSSEMWAGSRRIGPSWT